MQALHIQKMFLKQLETAYEKDTYCVESSKARG